MAQAMTIQGGGALPITPRPLPGDSARGTILNTGSGALGLVLRAVSFLGSHQGLSFLPGGDGEAGGIRGMGTGMATRGMGTGMDMGMGMATRIIGLIRVITIRGLDHGPITSTTDLAALRGMPRLGKMLNGVSGQEAQGVKQRIELQGVAPDQG